MLLFLYFILLLFLINFKKSASPSLLLVFVYTLSLGCGLLIGYSYSLNSFFQVFNLVFLIGTLTAFILPWNKFKYKISISEPNPIRLKRLTLVLFTVNAVAFILFSITIYYAFTTVIDYSAFKNLGESGALFETLPVNHILYLFALYLNSTSYLLIPLHFYYLSKNKYVYSTLSLILSLNIILNGLTVFSRSGFLVFLFLYLMYLPFFYSKFTHKIRLLIKVYALIIFVFATSVFLVITNNRFTDVVLYQEKVSSENIIKNPAVLSLFDYFSQWPHNYNYVMSMYSFNTLNGELSFPLVRLIAEKLQLIDSSPSYIELKLNAIWGSNFDKFNGLIANLVFDFGYVGTILFICLYLCVMRILRPVKGILSFNKFLVLGVVFVLPVMGIFNSEMKTVSYNLLIIYSLIIYAYMMRKTVTKEKYPKLSDFSHENRIS